MRAMSAPRSQRTANTSVPLPGRRGSRTCRTAASAPPASCRGRCRPSRARSARERGASRAATPRASPPGRSRRTGRRRARRWRSTPRPSGGAHRGGRPGAGGRAAGPARGGGRSAPSGWHDPGDAPRSGRARATALRGRSRGAAPAGPEYHRNRRARIGPPLDQQAGCRRNCVPRLCRCAPDHAEPRGRGWAAYFLSRHADTGVGGQRVAAGRPTAPRAAGLARPGRRLNARRGRCCAPGTIGPRAALLGPCTSTMSAVGFGSGRSPSSKRIQAVFADGPVSTKTFGRRARARRVDGFPASSAWRCSDGPAQRQRGSANGPPSPGVSRRG